MRSGAQVGVLELDISHSDIPVKADSEPLHVPCNMPCGVPLTPCFHISHSSHFTDHTSLGHSTGKDSLCHWPLFLSPFASESMDDSIHNPLCRNVQ